MLTQDQRIQVKTALEFDVLWAKILSQLGVIYNQIKYTNRHRVTPQKTKCRAKPKLKTLTRGEL